MQNKTAIDLSSLEAGRQLDKIIEQSFFNRELWKATIDDFELCLVPHFSTDAADAYKLETRIAELNLEQPYLTALWDLVGEQSNYDDAKGRFLYKHASPENICRASLIALAATKQG